MALSRRQLTTLRALRRYWYLRAAQVHDLIARDENRADWDKDNSITREVMRSLLALNFVRRYEPHPPGDPRTKGPPIYVLTTSGSCALAQETRDVADVLAIEPTFRDYSSLQHYLALSSLHMTIDRAFAAQKAARQHALYFEHEVIAASADPSCRYRLHTSFPHSNLKCCPDSALEFEVHGYRRALYFEFETGSDGSPQRVVAKKHKGYAQLQASGLFRRHFPQARDFRVVCMCPYASFRDSLRAAFREKRGEETVTLPGADLWLFALADEIRPETFLHEPLLWALDRGPFPLIPRPAPAPPAGAEIGAEPVPEASETAIARETQDV